MANLDFFGTSKMTVTKSQNRLRSFGAETRAEVPARRNSSKYVTLKIYNHALQNLRREALYRFGVKIGSFLFACPKIYKGNFGRARSYLTAPNLRHFRRDQILEVKTEMPETPIDRPL